MSELSPMLHQELSNAPQLGGDRRPVPCLYHGTLMIRDWFGNLVCMECVANQKRLEELRENPVCPHCGNPEYCCAGLEFIDKDTPYRFLYIYCDACEHVVWENHPSTFYWQGYSGADQSAYMRPQGHLTDWW